MNMRELENSLVDSVKAIIKEKLDLNADDIGYTIFKDYFMDNIKNSYIKERSKIYNKFNLIVDNKFCEKFKELNDFGSIDSKLKTFFASITVNDRLKEMVNLLSLVSTSRETALEERKINPDIYRIWQIKRNNKYLKLRSDPYTFVSKEEDLAELFKLCDIDIVVSDIDGYNKQGIKTDKYEITRYVNGNIQIKLIGQTFEKLYGLIKNYTRYELID